jgi:hypothetical protein
VPHSPNYVWRYGVQCHKSMAILANLASSRASLRGLYCTVAGMASQGGLAKQHRDTIPRWCQRVGVAGILP